jgi:L-threonylcarbamoyladenylate synthase
MQFPARAIDKAAAVLRNGGVVVMPTDTLYGVLGSALRPSVVTRIYRLRRRNPKKPMIILIADPREVRRFGVPIDARMRRMFRKYWPGKVSMVLRIKRWRPGIQSKDKSRYLHRGTGTVAFRVPKPKWLRELLQKTGPLVAPSANFEGDPPARTVREARRYFGTAVDYYLDGGRRAGKASTILAFRGNTAVILRK